MPVTRHDPFEQFAPATRVIHTGTPPRVDGAPLRASPVFAAAYHARGDGPFDFDVYGRSSNPTWRCYEEALSSLEAGGCVVFPSGLAAVVAVLETVVPSGGTVVMQEDSYYMGRKFAADVLRARGVNVRFVPVRELSTYVFSDCDLVMIETPSNPLLEVCHIEEVSRRCHEAGALLAVDNTTMTPLLQAPLQMGADLSVSSDTKALAGHSDVLLGHVAAIDDKIIANLRAHRESTGSIPGPMEVWLAHRSLATLDVRLRRQCANASEVANALRRIRSDLWVRYPRLNSAPEGMGGPVLTFTFDSSARAERFLDACRLVAEATSFGGVHSTAERRGRWQSDNVPPGFIRLSAGCEDTRDLVSDVVNAVDAAYV